MCAVITSTYIHVVGGGGHFFILLASEDVNGDEVTLGVTVLASLGCRDIHHLDNKRTAAAAAAEAAAARHLQRQHEQHFGPH